MVKISNFINGLAVPVSGKATIDVLDPATGKFISQLPLSRSIDIDAAVVAANAAYASWRLLSMKRKASVILKLSVLVESYSNELAALISLESGKNLQEALIDVSKCVEMLEWAVNLPQFAMGSQYELTRDVPCEETRQAIGVVAAILPFSSLAMVPMWTIPVALIMGNCVILKPSEKAPQTIQRLVELMVSAGVPNGVVQIVHGDAETTAVLCDHPGVHAVSFVGSSQGAECVARRCHALNKRVLALGGAKNHLLALPDCDVAMTSRDVVASFAGCAGQRCMAASVLVLVGDGSEGTKISFTDHLLKDVVACAKLLTPGKKAGQMGPLIDRRAQKRVLEYINEAEANGATILLDGRHWATEQAAGFWVGPTIILHSNVEDRAMKEEIFGPVLSVYLAASWDEAIAIENKNSYGNTASVFTEKGANAEWFVQRFRAGLLGINDAFAGIREPYSSGGVRGTLSHFGGGGDLWGEGCVDFFSQRVRTVSRWAPIGTCGSPSKDMLALRPLVIPNRSSSMTPLSPPHSAGKKHHAMNPRSPEFTLPLSRNNSLRGEPMSREGMFRRESSSGTTREAMSRESSGLSDVTECDASETGDGTSTHVSHTSHHTVNSYHGSHSVPKSASKFHGIAATSPFASKDPHFDFDLEKLKREDSFQPFYSAQPSFDVDPHGSLGCGGLDRFESKDWSVASGFSQEESCNNRTSAAYYDVDLYNVEALVAAQNEFVDSVVTEIGPQDSQLKYQHSSVRYVKKLLRKALQCNIFETGLHGIRCFLPSDDLRLSVVLSGKLEPCWHTLARDGLLKACAPPSSPTSDNGIPAPAPVTDSKHAIKRVECIKVGSELKVTCLCDTTQVEISLNARDDVCILAFFEEVDVLVGSDNLFKRSLMLIRAWWHHETLEAIDVSTRALLNDTAICIMVCAVFNQFHSRITTPLQALTIFLAEYSAYDGSAHVVTLQGIVPFHGPEGPQAHHIEPNKKHLLSPSIVEKYQQLFNLADVPKIKVATPTNQNGIASLPSPASVAADVQPAAPVQFIREAFNVLHPFMPVNVVVTGTAEDRKLGLLPRAFTEGAKILSLAISTTYATESTTLSTDFAAAFVNILKSRFGDLPVSGLVEKLDSSDAQSVTPPYGSSDVSVSVDKHWQNIMYCNFIIKGVVSESAILTFCIDVLSMIGLMTADDLGKRLNEASRVPQLMVALKDQVGGLKEFLKRFPDVFVFSFEHPYNPHIFLRIVLSPDLQAEVENGVLPVKFLSQIIAKFGRIAPPPPKVDSPSLRRKVLVPTAAAVPVSHSNSVLDEKVVFGHERSAGGANTLRLMQSDIDLVNVVGGADSNRLHNDSQSQSQSQSLQIGAVSSSTTFHNPYAAPFVPGQALPHSRKVHVNGHASHQQHQQHQQHQAAAPVPLTLHGAAVTPLSIHPTSSSFYQQDLSMMSSSVLNSGVSLNNKGNSNGGNISSNSSLAGGGPSRLLYDLDFQDTLLDSASDYFGDSLSLNGDSLSASGAGRGGSNNLLLSSLRENSTELRDDSLLDEYPPAINLSSLSGLNGLNSLGMASGLTSSGLGAGNAGARGGVAAFGSGGRSSSGLTRYPGGLEGFGNTDFDFETSSQSSHDAYHQAASGSSVTGGGNSGGGGGGGGGSINGGNGKGRGYTGPHLLSGEEFGVGGDAGSANSAYIPNTYGGYHGAADYQHQPPQQQQQQHGHPAHHPHQQQQQHHAPGGYGGPGGYVPGAQGQQGQGQVPHGQQQQRGMVRSNSRPLMLNSQGQPIPQQQHHHHHQQPKFQHKRYDPSQQYNNKK